MSLKHFIRFLFAVVLCFATSQSVFGAWLRQDSLALKYMLQNIAPVGASRGAIVASPSKVDPDYFFHWVRDASLVVNVVVDLYIESPQTVERSRYFHLIFDFANFSRLNQITPTLGGSLGEPKFYPDGNAYLGPWGRPQNDGPALRAIALSRFALALLKEGKEELVRRYLYEAEIPAHKVVKADLEFVSHHWPDKCFDLWEEISGEHFYTRMVQRKALKLGARLAFLLDDPGASSWYEAQAKALEKPIHKHWDAQSGIIRPTLNQNDGIEYKYSELDSAIILAVLHGDTEDGFLSVSDERVLSTAYRLEETFTELYPINKNGTPGVLIGRYPEDRYDGHVINGHGNPWVLITAAFAELHHKLAAELTKTGSVTFTKWNIDYYRKAGGDTFVVGTTLTKDEFRFQHLIARLKSRGDDFIQRLSTHSVDGHFSEQINRWSGKPQGARDLTWSYAAYLTAIRSRNG